jgi:hypothetical protein
VFDPEPGPRFTLPCMNTRHRASMSIGRLAADRGIGIDALRH